MKTEKVHIDTDFIKLDQFLKWAGVYSSGTDAKNMIKEGVVIVNGEKETRRGRKLKKKDIVDVEGNRYEIV